MALMISSEMNNKNQTLNQNKKRRKLAIMKQFQRIYFGSLFYKIFKNFKISIKSGTYLSPTELLRKLLKFGKSESTDLNYSEQIISSIVKENISDNLFKRFSLMCANYLVISPYLILRRFFILFLECIKIFLNILLITFFT